MRGKFIMSDDADAHVMEWGRLGWLSNPAVTGAKQMTVIAGTFSPGYGHTFHYHPAQEEVIYVLAGCLEHWNEHEKRILGPWRLRLHSCRACARLVQRRHGRRQGPRDPWTVRRGHRSRAGRRFRRGPLERAES
jgi:hypothetical protein